MRLFLLLGPFYLAIFSAGETGAADLHLDYQKVVTTNGITLIVNEDRSLPLVSIHVWYRAGGRNDSEGSAGLAHLSEHLMFNGSENYDKEWFATLLEMGGTSIGGETYNDYTAYHQTVPTSALDSVLWLESERMGHLLGAVTLEKLNEQRGVVRNEVLQNDNNPYGRLVDRLYEGLFPVEHPYHRSVRGSIEQLNAASLAQVHQWIQEYYTPNNAVIVLSGDIDLATARRKVEMYFGGIPARQQVDQWTEWLPSRKYSSRSIQYDSVPTSRVQRAWAIPSNSARDFALLSLAATVLGEGRNGLLPADVVHGKEVATMAFATVGPMQICSVFSMWVELKPGIETWIATEAMDRVLARFLTQGPTREELERAVAVLTSRALERLGDRDGRARALAEGEVAANDPGLLTRYLGWIESASADDVRNASRRYLDTGWHQVEVLPRWVSAVPPMATGRPKDLPPISSALPSINFPEADVSTLSNGSRLIVAEHQGASRTYISIQFEAGNAADAVTGKLGTASFALDMLDEGTRSRDALEIAAEADRLGVDISFENDLDSSTIALAALPNKLEASLALCLDMIRNAAFESSRIERVRAGKLVAITGEQVDPERTAFRVLRQISFGKGHGYSIPRSGLSDVESISSISRDDLIRFRENWLRPDNATIFVVGNMTVDEVRPIIERTFRDWRAPGTALPRKDVQRVSRAKEPRIILVDRPGSLQSLILGGDLALGSDAPNELALQAASSILGGQFTSRINMNLREQKQWSYGASSGMADARGQRSFQINAPIQADRTGDALGELLRELRDFVGKRQITEGEKEAFVSNATRQLPAQFERADAVLESLRASWRFGRPLDWPNGLAQRYRSLSLEDLRAAARQLINPDSMVWVVVGDRKRIEGQLTALQLAPIEYWPAN
jgi:zinc protease